MTATKKNSAKSTKSPAPATKIAKPTAKTKRAPAATKSSGRVVPASAPKLETVKAPSVVTTITARIDIGFGNLLYVRGEGPGLSWDRGIAMKCVASDQWDLVLGESARPFIFKFLVNDLTWSSGADFILESGGSATVTPEF